MECNTPTLPAWIAETIGRHAVHPDDEARSAPAIGLARRNVEHATCGPLGATVFDRAGRLLALRVDRVLPLQSSLAHAEILAPAAARRKPVRARRHDDGCYILATISQPCCQRHGAIFWAGVDPLPVGARTEDTEPLAGSDEGPLPPDWAGELTRRGMRVSQDLQRNPARAVLAAYARNDDARH